MIICNCSIVFDPRSCIVSHFIATSPIIVIIPVSCLLLPLCRYAHLIPIICLGNVRVLVQTYIDIVHS